MSKIVSIKLSEWITNQNVVRLKLSEWIAKEKNLPLEIDGVIIEEREKAVKIEYVTTATVWLPKSQITIDTPKKQGE